MSRVEDIMKRQLFCVSPSTPVIDAERKMRRHGLTLLPVCENGRPKGLISHKNIADRNPSTARNPKREQVREVMSCKPLKVSIGTDTLTATKLMASHGVTQLCVIQNGGRLVGLLSLEDLTDANPALVGMVYGTNTHPQGHSVWKRRRWVAVKKDLAMMPEACL